MGLEKHKEIVIHFLTVLNTGVNADFSRWDEIVHPDYSSGLTPEVMIQNTMPGREEFKKRIKHVNICIPDLRYEIKSLVAEADEVIVHHDVYATNVGGLWNIPPNNYQAKILGFHRFKFLENKIIKLWLVFDTFKLLSDLGHAILNKNNREEITKYMENLKELGLIPLSAEMN